MTAKRIHQVLVEHETHTDWFRRRGGYCWSCSCETDGEGVHRTYAAASEAAAWHVAEQLSQVLVGAGAGGGRR